MTATDEQIDLDQYAKQLDKAHVFHSWSAQKAFDPLVIAGGLGTKVWDHAGNEYLDFSSQLVNVNIGHQHPKLVAAIQEQAGKLATIGPATGNLTRAEAAERITARTAAGLDKVFFTNGGADAIENAVRMARLHTGRRKVLSTYRSYHGNTGSAINATGDWRRLPNEYATGHVHFFGPFLYRTEFWATTPEEECERALQHLRRIIEVEGPNTVAAILLESIPGTAGIMIPPPGYLAGVRDARRPARHRADPRRGDGRLRPRRRVVRARRARRRARPHRLRQGRELRLRAGGRRGDQRGDRRRLRRDRLPRRPHLLRPPAGRGVDRGVDRRDGGRRASSPTPSGSATTCSAPPWPSWPRSTR